MNIKTGIDIIEVNRIQDSIEKLGDRFLKRVYTEQEISYCESRKTQKFQSYSARFAAKEAVFKAISSLIDNKYDVKWKEIEIVNDETGRPFVKLNGSLEELLRNKVEIDISLSHIKETAIANAIVIY